MREGMNQISSSRIDRFIGLALGVFMCRWSSMVRFVDRVSEAQMHFHAILWGIVILMSSCYQIYVQLVKVVMIL